MPKPWGERQRSYQERRPIGDTMHLQNGNLVVYNKGRQELSHWGTQITGSEGHSKLPQSRKWSGGGPFFTVKGQTHQGWTEHVFHLEDSVDGTYSYSGSVATPLVEALPFPLKRAEILKTRPSTDHDLDVAGTKAISAVAPTNPSSHLGEGLAEIIREGAPKIPGIQAWENRANLLKSAGSEFLNYEFGWAPLLNEIDEVKTTINTHNLVMEQYERDAGKNVRRRFDFPIDRSVSEFVEQENSHAIVGNDVSSLFRDKDNLGKLVRRTSIERKRWFSGCFTYAVPSTGNSWEAMLSNAAKANKFFGINVLSPDVLWELTPWSWAIDWFSNAGELMNDLTQFKINGLVMRYGYVMEHYTKRTEVELTKSGLYRCPAPPPSYTSIEWKIRRPANPFGFGIGWEGLTPIQLAIAAAVGISRL